MSVWPPIRRSSSKPLKMFSPLPSISRPLLHIRNHEESSLRSWWMLTSVLHSSGKNKVACVRWMRTRLGSSPSTFTEFLDKCKMSTETT